MKQALLYCMLLVSPSLLLGVIVGPSSESQALYKLAGAYELHALAKVVSLCHKSKKVKKINNYRYSFDSESPIDSIDYQYKKEAFKFDCNKAELKMQEIIDRIAIKE